MKEIKLIQGKVALVDDVDYEMVNKFKWYLWNNNRISYAVRNIRYKKLRKTIRMHRFILNVSSDRYVDHKNFNGLDNRRCNIRIATYLQNQWNRRLDKNNKSGFKGVCFIRNNNKWMSYIKINCKRIYLGSFNSKIEAAKEYDKNAIKYFGEFARTNKMLGLLS